MRLTLGLVLASTCVLAACGGAHSSAGDTIAGGALPSFDNRTKPAAAGQTIYEFQGPPTDGGSPFGNLLLGSDGNFYGTTNSGGIGPRFRDGGTVFEVSPTGTERVLYTFRGGADGGGSEAGVTEGTGGVLYGATDYGGGSPACSGGCGTVFALVPNGSNYTEHVLHAFQGGSDGANPIGNVVVDGSGDIYGATDFGGTGTGCAASTGDSGCGTVYELTPSGSSYTERVLHSFQGGSDGALPADSLIRDSGGALYGTTQYGGGTTGCQPDGSDTSCGIVFRVTPAGRETVLYRFHGGTTDGGNPRSELYAVKNSHRFFGAAGRGGNGTICGTVGCGVIFELTRAGNAYVEKVLYSFGGVSGGGIHPSDQGGLVVDAEHNIFGTTVSGGSAACFCGTVFELSPSRSGYTERVLQSFKGGNGAFPHASITADASGALYGVTFNAALRVHGCDHGCGTVFKVTP